MPDPGNAGERLGDPRRPLDAVELRHDGETERRPRQRAA